MKWFKFYGQDYISDPKMLSLTASERSCWITLLSYASVNDNGMITFLSEQQLMIQAGLDFQQEEWDMTTGVLEKFKRLEMIQYDNGMITVKNWQKRQETSLTSYERVKRFREKKRNDNGNDNAMITSEENRIDKNRIDKKREENTSLELEKSILEEIFNLWNSQSAFIGSCKNITAKKRLLPKCREITPDIISAFGKLKDYKFEDMQLSLKNYIQDIINRSPENDYAKHRFSFYEFFKQANGFKKYLNK